MINKYHYLYILRCEIMDLFHQIPFFLVISTHLKFTQLFSKSLTSLSTWLDGVLNNFVTRYCCASMLSKDTTLHTNSWNIFLLFFLGLKYFFVSLSSRVMSEKCLICQRSRTEIFAFNCILCIS